MRLQQKEAGILLTWCTEGVKVAVVLLYTPLMLRLLGQRDYGVYQLAASAAAGLSLLSFGFGSAYVRSYAQCREDGEALAGINGMFLLIFTAMAVLCLMGGVLLWILAPKLFGQTLTPEELSEGKRILAILTVNMAMTFPNSLFEGYLTARERFGFSRLLRLCQSVLNPVLTLPLLLLGYGSVSLAAVATVLTAGCLGMNIAACRKKWGMALSFRKLPLSQLGDLGRFSFFIFLNQLIDQLNWSVDKVLLGSLQGAEAVAVYGIAAQLLTLYIHFSTAISGVFVPKVHRLTASGCENGALTDWMIRVGRIQLLLQSLILSGYLCFGEAFICLWAGKENREAYAVGLLLMAPMTIPLVQNLGLEIQRAKNKHQARSLVYACLAGANAALSLLWIPRWGCTGAAAATALTQFMGTGLFMNWYYHRKIGLNMVRFWSQSVSMLLPAAISCLPALLVTRLCPIQSWIGLAVSVCLYTAGYGIIAWKWSLNDWEKRKLHSLLIRKGESYERENL